MSSTYWIPSKFLLTYIYSAIFQAGGLIVVVVEVTRKAYLASLVPVIVNVILNEHQVVADIVAFVSNGDFPRSRLGEKQRGKVLASWVTRKLRTIAQFSIRDSDDNPFADVPQHRASRGSKPGSTMGNSIRRSNTNPEPDASAVPRSPAPVVLEEERDVPPEAYHHPTPPRNTLPELDTQTESHVPSTPVSGATSTVPHIQEPQSATIHSTDDDHEHFETKEPEPAPVTGPAPVTTSPEQPGSNRDFRFSFDIVSTPMESLPPGSAQPVQERISTGRDSLPSQHRYGGVHAVTSPTHDEQSRPRTQESGVSGDWPQEALMYQRGLAAEDGHNAQRTPSAGAQQRYDGSGYGP